jgi:CxxC motif-containing protein (DUF1111 family)
MNPNRLRRPVGRSFALIAAVAVAPGCQAAVDDEPVATDESDLSSPDDDLIAQAGPTNPKLLHPVERVPRAKFGHVGQFPLTVNDMPAFVYPSLSNRERNAVLPGLTFFTTPHTANEGLGPVANQAMCLGCHLNSQEAVPGFGLVSTVSHVSRAARATTTNFEFTKLNPATGGGVAPDDLDALNGPGSTAAFTVFGDFNPTTQAFDELPSLGGFVQHHRPSIAACLPDPIPSASMDPHLKGGVDPVTRESKTGFRRAVGERAGPPYIGRGLIEAIFESTILANEDADDQRDHNSSLRGSAPRFAECTGDCISGRHNENTSNQAFEGGEAATRIGRFGLRAGGPTILQFVVGGVNGELSFTSPFKMTELSAFINDGNPQCKDTVPEPEVASDTVLALRRLIRMTAPPELGDTLLTVLESSDPNRSHALASAESRVHRGAQLFGVDLTAMANRMLPGRMPYGGDGRDEHAINQSDRGLNCVGCHTPIQPTGRSPAQIGGKHLSNVWAPVFTDVLLHEGPEVTAERLASAPRDPVVVTRDGKTTLDISRNLSDDALFNQGVATGREFRTAPLMGMGVIGAPYLHDGRVFLSNKTVNSLPAGTVYSNSKVTNAPLVVETLDDAIRAAIELHDLPPPDDAKTPYGGGCPVPNGRAIGEIRYPGGPADICPPYTSAVSVRNRSEAREVMRRYRALSPHDQQALIDFLKQL